MYKSKKNVYGQTSALIFTLCTGIGASSFAPSVLGAAEGRLELQTFEVTGSRIPRTDTEGMAPVALFDRDDIDRSGATTIMVFGVWEVPLSRCV
ncbi:MAG: hypothetical protein JMN24_10630 [gamma proteobacterium endosymbiont of Lamellibrachia anaximandri]|nr:hypothetical protein [gamma proteobacterium endosymbiont of Lamellibrachia anaximandri]MBL3617493.1 hypothetical protein [gamma proteobacterium endosymbiont of Lamellibrachia anaximandri]